MTIQKEGSSIGTFTANSDTDTAVNVVETDPTVPSWAKQSTKPTYSYSEITNKPTIPTKTSDLTNDGSDGTSTYVEDNDLAAVATSGSYSDLSGAPNVVQTLGTSTADIMSQDAVTSSLFKNTSTLNSIAIGSTDDYDVTGSVQIGALTEAPEDYCIAIGYNARGSAGGYPYKAVTIGMNSKTGGESSIAIGSGAEAVSDFSTTIGHNAHVSSSEHSVALGDGSYIDYNTDNYVVSVGCDPGLSQRTAFTRRIINVTNPVNAQDAATKNYVDTASSLIELSYGNSTWSDFITAYQAGKIVYCRASSNSNPATGTQGRKAFMAYVNNAENPTEVEFQYVRSVSSKTASQPVDQVYVYKLTNASGGTWTVQTRDMAPKLAQGTNTTVSYSNGTYTISATDTTYSNMTGASASAAGAAGLVPAPAAGDQGKFLQGNGTWAAVQSGPTVVQTTGQSTTDVMSQKAVTDIIGDIETILQTLNSGTGAQ